MSISARSALLACTIAIVSACAPMADAPEGASGAGNQPIAVRDAAGKRVAEVSLEEGTTGVTLTVTSVALSQGFRGIHVHQTGRCDAPDFATAGAHWNPAEHKHGLANGGVPHAGDMPNFAVDEEGEGMLTFTLSGTTLADLRDADGAALVIHADSDDQRTDPSGNSGARIACAVL